MVFDGTLLCQTRVALGLLSLMEGQFKAGARLERVFVDTYIALGSEAHRPEVLVHSGQAVEQLARVALVLACSHRQPSRCAEFLYIRNCDWQKAYLP